MIVRDISEHPEMEPLRGLASRACHLSPLSLGIHILYSMPIGLGHLLLGDAVGVTVPCFSILIVGWSATPSADRPLPPINILRFKFFKGVIRSRYEKYSCPVTVELTLLRNEND